MFCVVHLEFHAVTVGFHPRRCTYKKRTAIRSCENQTDRIRSKILMPLMTPSLMICEK